MIPALPTRPTAEDEDLSEAVVEALRADWAEADERYEAAAARWAAWNGLPAEAHARHPDRVRTLGDEYREAMSRLEEVTAVALRRRVRHHGHQILVEDA